MDWAEEIGEKICGLLVCPPPDGEEFWNTSPVSVHELSLMIAAALRKVARENKAAGMREADEWVETLLEKYPRRYVIGDLLRIQANKIEHGEPTE